MGNVVGLENGPLPLVIDIDGALLPTSLERAILNQRENAFARFLRQWPKGRRFDLEAAEKAQQQGDLALCLQINPDIMALAATQKRLGGQVFVIGTAQMEMVAALVDILSIEAECFGADPDEAFGAKRQDRILTALFGQKGFTFVGGAKARPSICLLARHALLVDGPVGAKARFRTYGGHVTLLPPPVWGQANLLMKQLCVGIGSGGKESLNQKVSRQIWLKQEGETKTRAPMDARKSFEKPDRCRA